MDVIWMASKAFGGMDVLWMASKAEVILYMLGIASVYLSWTMKLDSLDIQMEYDDQGKRILVLQFV